MPTILTETILKVNASPIRAAPLIHEQWPDRVSTTMDIDKSEPVLDGHFPGFAIFPGVCLIECAHQTALLALAQRSEQGARPWLAAIETVRFLSPVYPGDRIIVELTVLPLDGGWRCPARVLVRRGLDAPPVEAAILKLRYTTGVPPR
jgi:3-hydroxyacyl-[acyl-carrier-protein] dehydratase